MRRPLIGVTSWHRPDREERFELIRDTYTRAVLEAGGLPVILPIAPEKPELVEGYVGSLDGLLLTGGEDVHPRHYGDGRRPACQEPDEERDAFELAVARRAIGAGKPTFGICRGLQLINVALGGTLYQDVGEFGPTELTHAMPVERRGEPAHRVRIVPGTRLAAITQREEVEVTSTHHQVVRNLAPGLRVNAAAPDGIIEGFEGTGGSFLLAVQWHPERLVASHEEHAALFRALTEAAEHSR